MSYLKDREIWLSSVPTGNPPAGYVWVFIQNGVFVVRDSNGVDKIMATTTGTVTNATSASYVEYSNVADKPALISGSSQVSYTGLSDIPAGIVSGSVQVGEYGVFATTGSNQFNGSQAITGSLTVTGQVVAQTLNVQQVTSSIVYSSGSNVFGNSLDNTQQFTGSVSVTGSLAVAGALSGTSAIFSGSSTLLTLSSGAGTKVVFATTRNFSVNRNFQIAVDEFAESAFTITPSTTLGGSGYTTPIFTLAAAGTATFSSIVNVGFDSNNRSTIRLTSNAANRQAAIYFYGNNVESAVLGYEGGSEIVSGGIQGDFVIRNVLANKHIILATNNGNVGIGTLIPTGKLSVEATGNHITLRAPGATAGKYWALDITTENRFYLMNNAGTQYLTITDAGAATFTNSVTTNGTITSLASSGQASIIAEGTATNGEGAFTLRGKNSSGTVRSALFKYDNADILRIGTPAPIDFRFETNDTERMRITSGGNVGIGNTNPSGKLSVNDSIYGEYLRVATGVIGGNETSVFLAWNNAGNISLQQVTVGAADSGGSGFRLLRIPNT